MDIVNVLSKGLSVTLSVLLGSVLLSFLLAFIAGFCRISSGGIARTIATVYVEFFRGTSLIVQMFWIYFSFPISPYVAGIVAIGLNYGAYMSEVVRGAILAVPTGQTEASISLNMSRFQRMRLVILPQAIRMMLPEFSNYLIQMLKGTSLVYLIGLADITYQAMIYQNSNYDKVFYILSTLLLMYFVLALPFVWLTRWLERLAAKGVVNG